MSVGTWLLAAYTPLNVAAAAQRAVGRGAPYRARGRRRAGLLGTAVATYTAALIADTAVPAWHEGVRELPFLFAGSAASAAGGVALVARAARRDGAARRLAGSGYSVSSPPSG